jgi:hypothetical protein
MKELQVAQQLCDETMNRLVETMNDVVELKKIINEELSAEFKQEYPDVVRKELLKDVEAEIEEKLKEPEVPKPKKGLIQKLKGKKKKDDTAEMIEKLEKELAELKK